MIFPLAFPDEILFSRIVRHFILTGMTIENYLSSVFDNNKVTIHPYLTAGLAPLSEFSQESPFELMRDQTLAPLFIHFLPSFQSTISSGLVSSNAAYAIRACQLTSVKEKESLSIKFCPQCAIENTQEFGTSYWHRSHQIPGIESCYKHQVWLVHLPLVERSKLSHGFLPQVDISPKQSSLLSYELAKYAASYLNFVSTNNQSFNVKEIITQLDKLGFVTEDGHFRRKRLVEDFYQFTQKMAYKSQHLLPESSTDFRYVSYLLSGKVSQHPFKYLLLGFWLSKHLPCEEHNVPLPNDSAPADQLESKCIALLHQGESMASVGRLIGKSRCYVKALALRLNIPVNLKPKLITEVIKSKIMYLAHKGFHRNAIAKRVGISVGSVEQQISTSPELVCWRKQCKHESKRRRYKLQITRFIQRKPKAIRQLIKSSCNAAFFWLYAYEKQWLELHLPKAQKPVPKPRVDWQQRDAMLVEKVKSIMLQHNTQLSRTQLDKLLGNHGWLTKNKHKLPLTIKEYHSSIKK
ncbi:TnsD family transposase [Rheinheimera sp. UJ51]|uniref:TnsD family transposase n=1 Tax=Rheinheimera sp. UJ51 TaxID=2892446 RepID=UPI001E5308C6|nr:TnsD family transposase [Rheinheimera sp. UJ51]MCC5450697.1 TnsD family transposase [Rheinheimera sp. UJ51]